MTVILTLAGIVIVGLLIMAYLNDDEDHTS